MAKHHQWLKQEVAQWQAEGLVDSALAQRILGRYPETAERGWGRIVFSAIGAVLVGLGVILFFAYNWHVIPKPAKLALVFGALAAAHGTAMTLARSAQPNRGLIEGLHALGTMLFGAGIWLVAQIYHIDELYPNAFLVWSLGALALAWAMPSRVQAPLALFLIVFCESVESLQFRAPLDGALPPVLASADAQRIEGLGRAAVSALEIHRALQRQPLATAASLVAATGLTPATVNKSLAHLERLGVVTELTRKQRGRIFSYARYADILNEGMALPDRERP